MRCWRGIGIWGVRIVRDEVDISTNEASFCEAFYLCDKCVKSFS